jgi:PAS domain S-box-containing protein
VVHARATQQVVARLAVLEAFVDAADEAMLCLDRDGRILSWNHAGERLSGYAEEEVLGEAMMLLFPAHLRSHYRIVADAVVVGDRLDHFETEVQRKDGMPLPVSLSGRPVHDDGEFVAFVLIARDITERQVAQATLAEIDRRVREAEAIAHAGGWLWDVRTGAVQWSDELHRIHGVDPLEFEGTLDAHLERVHAEDRERVRTAMESAVASGRAFEAEYRLIHASGDIRWLHARAEPSIGSGGDVVGMRGIGHDVTDSTDSHA